MKILSSICFVYLVCVLGTTAQSVVGGIPGKGLDMQTNPGGFVTQLPAAPPETKGDVYLNPEWAMTNMIIYNHQGELRQVQARLDLQSNDFELNIKDQIKILAGGKVKEFKMVNPKSGQLESFINGGEYTLAGSPIIGFFKVIDSARWELLIKTELKLVQGAYVAALDAGVKDNELVKKEIYFFAKDHQLYQVYPSARKFYKQFGEGGAKLKSHIQDKKISLKKPEDLFLLSAFLNREY